MLERSMLDAGWGILKTQLLYKGEYAGRCVQVVNERNTTRTCSSCDALTGPAGLDMIVVRTWECRECGVVHDRDVNAARNILKVGVRSRVYSGSPPSVNGNELPRAVAEPSQTYSRCEAGISELRLAA
jgi:transposase